MNTLGRQLIAVAILGLMVMLPAVRAAETPINFARDGQRMKIHVTDRDGDETVALWAHGRPWAEQVTIARGVGEIVAPNVRVPVLFRVAPVGEVNVTLGELLVYPDRPARWNEKLLLRSVGTPRWFNDWSAAVGLPIKQLASWEDESDPDSSSDASRLAIVGRKGALKSLAALQSVAAKRGHSIFVLEADWFGDVQTTTPPLAITPKQMADPLLALQTQVWSQPPVFSRNALPWPGISNRQTWIAGPEYPLVEELRGTHAELQLLRIIASYLPWQEQLGRCELADELFLGLLMEAAQGVEGRQPLEGCCQLLWPDAAMLATDNRPVLTAALSSRRQQELRSDGPCKTAVESRGTDLFVLDVRGPKPCDRDVLDAADGVRAFERLADSQGMLLILGDDPLLDERSWFKLDRQQHHSARTNVLWWPDDQLPSSFADQLRLMQFFTQWHIPLETISQENEP